mgnify:CR=1 FL=1
MDLQRSSSLDSLKVIPADDYERSAFALSPDVYGSAKGTAVSADVSDAAADPCADAVTLAFAHGGAHALPHAFADARAHAALLVVGEDHDLLRPAQARARAGDRTSKLSGEPEISVSSSVTASL